MKKLALLAVLALALVTTAHAGWWKTYGGAGNELGNCIQITSNGNFIISGLKNLNLWLIEIDTSGNVIWDRTYPDNRSEGVFSRWLEETIGGDYIVAPWSPSLLKLDVGGDTLWEGNYGIYSYCVQEASDGGYVVIGGSNGYGYDPSLVFVKTNFQGDSLWGKSLAPPGHNRNTGYFIQRTDDEGLIITGMTGIESEEYAYTALWLVKTDSNGDTLWTREYGSTDAGSFSRGHCVRQTSDNGYIITGIAPGGIWLLKTDSLGDTLWTRIYSTPSGGEGYCVQETSDGGYIITGVNQNWSTFMLDPEDRDLWLIKTNNQGDTLWTRFYGADDSDAGFSVLQTADSGYIIVGQTRSYGAGSGDVYLLRTDSLGLLSIKEQPVPKLVQTWEVTPSLGPQITIRYFDRPQGFTAHIYDSSGREVGKLCSSSYSGVLCWGESYAPGVYFIAVSDVNTMSTAKVVLTH